MPAILPVQIRHSVSAMPHLLWVYGAFLVLSYACFSISHATHRLRTQQKLYLAHGLVLLLFLGFAVEIMILISSERSAKAVAQTAVPRIRESTQVVFYDTHLAGMAFYLRAERPIWLVTHGHKKRTFLGNYYAVDERRDLTTRWGDAIFDFEEFREKWRTAKQPLLIVVKEKNLQRFTRNVGEAPKRLNEIDEYLLVTRNKGDGVSSYRNGTPG